MEIIMAGSRKHMKPRKLKADWHNLDYTQPTWKLAIKHGVCEPQVRFWKRKLGK